jgi:hypothetical protein
MIRLMAVAFALVVATSAEAKSHAAQPMGRRDHASHPCMRPRPGTNQGYLRVEVRPPGDPPRLPQVRGIE